MNVRAGSGSGKIRKADLVESIETRNQQHRNEHLDFDQVIDIRFIRYTDNIVSVGQMWATWAADRAKVTQNKRLRDDSNGIRAR
jgi:hypothetical protein